MNYPQLQNINHDRVAEIGGKAAILEEIINQKTDLIIPEFNLEPVKPEPEETRVLRISHELDIFGGNGLWSTYSHVNQNNFNEVYRNLQRSPRTWVEQEMFQLFAQSHNMPLRPKKIFSQVQSKPDFWGVVMQHPDNPKLYLIAYSDSPSEDCENSIERYIL